MHPTAPRRSPAARHQRDIFPLPVAETAELQLDALTPAEQDSLFTSSTRADPWPFAPLSDQQLRERGATEIALRNGRMRAFRAFDDTVAGALA